MKTLKKIGIFAFIALLLVTVYAYFEDKIIGYYDKNPEEADRTPPAIAASIDVDTPVETAEDGAFLGDQLITLADNTDYTLTVPAGAVRAQFQVQDNAVYLRFGGSPVNGGFLCAVEELHTLDSPEEMKKAVFRTKAGQTAKLIINYWAE